LNAPRETCYTFASDTATAPDDPPIVRGPRHFGRRSSWCWASLARVIETW